MMFSAHKLNKQGDNIQSCTPFPSLKYLIFFSFPLESVHRSLGFPDSSAGKESSCNARDPGSILGSERSPGEGIGYPLRYTWASLVAQMVKNLPAMWET